MCHGDEKQCWHQSWDFWSMSRFTLALQLILSDKPSARTHTHNQYRLLKVGVWTCYETSNPEIWGKTVEHVSRWRKTVLAPELRLLVNEQIYTGSPIDSEWQTKRAHTHKQYRLWKWGFELAMRHQTLRFEKNSWACVTVTKNSVGTRAETFGQWADLHWLSNWFWVTNQARAHTHNQYRLLLKVGVWTCYETSNPEIWKNSWACVTVTKNSVGTRAETFGQWADLHWLSNWFWVTNQARAHTHNQYRLLKVGVWTCYETSNPEIWGKTVEHVSRWR